MNTAGHSDEQYENIRQTLHPILVLDDSYSGVYSGTENGGRGWIAVANSDRLLAEEEMDRFSFPRRARGEFILQGGPSGDDPDAEHFWRERPQWVAVGHSPDHAVENLMKKF